jgi:protein gp37
MAKETEIAWTDSTFNPWWGCQKTGPGCDRCYAEQLDKRTGGAHWGVGADRRRTSVKNWNDPIRWNAKHEEFFALHGRRQRVFCASMADVFDNAVPVEWRIDLFSLVAKTPHLDWLMLTKRIGNVMPMCSGDSLMFDMLCERVWLGATIVNQQEADRDLEKLLAVPAHKRFLSMEPLLGPVDLQGLCDKSGNAGRALKGLDWLIVGGESGPGARPMHPDWVRSLRDQCEAAKVAFLFKQWGEWRPMALDEVPERGMNCHLVSNGSKQVIASGCFHMAHQIKSMISEPYYSWQCPILRVGKNSAGRLLDGCLYDQFPSLN